MKINSFLRKKQKRSSYSIIGNNLLSFGLNDLYSTAKALKLSAVYRAIELKSNAVATIPMQIFNTNSKGDKIQYSRIDGLHYLLNERPSDRLDSYTFWKMMTIDLDINGNAYALIIRDKKLGEPVELIYVPPELVIIPNADMVFETPRYLVTGYPDEVSFKNIIHIRNHTKNGIRGISTLSYAAHTLGIAWATERTASNTFENGGKLTGVYTVSTRLEEEDRANINKNWRETFSSPDSTGIVILETGDTFQPLQMNNKDMMMIESRQFNVVDIARFFNVSPILLFDFSKMSYAGLEEVQLEFLTNTIFPLLRKIEKEINYKFFGVNEIYTRHIKFDTTDFIKTDKKTTAEYYSKLFNAAMIQPNEVRNELGYKDVPGGNYTYIQGGMMKVEDKNNETVNPPSEPQPTVDNDLLNT